MKNQGRVFILILIGALLFSNAAFAETLAPKDPKGSLISFLKKGNHSYRKLKDYKALFIKIEREEGVLGAEERIYLKFEKPWKIFMKWMEGEKKGLEVAYERGKHKNNLMIHKPGLLLGLGPSVVYLDQNSPWVRKGSASYDIEDAGIGTFLEDFTAAVAQSSREKKLKVECPSESFFDVTFLDSKDDDIYFAYRVKVLFDTHSHLPVKMELFDWQNQPMGIYEYRELELNTGQNEAFKKEINRNLLKVYNS